MDRRKWSVEGFGMRRIKIRGSHIGNEIRLYTFLIPMSIVLFRVSCQGRSLETCDLVNCIDPRCLKHRTSLHNPYPNSSSIYTGQLMNTILILFSISHPFRTSDTNALAPASIDRNQQPNTNSPLPLSIPFPPAHYPAFPQPSTLPSHSDTLPLVSH